MTRDTQVRGMLLEEAILELLRNTGFAVVDAPNGDPTLDMGPAGLVVHGRGADHQIDAIGDFLVAMPFSHPGRLIVEAKCHKKNIGLEVVRNVNGVLRDVSEFFVPSERVQRARYHYHAAIFSATDFTADAQRYAYAHDIFIVPLAGNAAFRPIIDAIFTINSARMLPANATLGDLRRIARETMRYGYFGDAVSPLYASVLSQIATQVANLGESFLARTVSGFPLFLSPASREAVEVARTTPGLRIRVRHDRTGWRISSLVEKDEQPLFTFDMPEDLFDIYYPEDRPRPRSALTMKQVEFDEIVAFRVSSGRIEMLTMALDHDWLEQARRKRRH